MLLFNYNFLPIFTINGTDFNSPRAILNVLSKYWKYHRMQNISLKFPNNIMKDCDNTLKCSTHQVI